ncbi:hypothetical protein JJJ17_13345 [Paracoccus caeni]|uniref:GAD-related domain-containing protein n=1 Tax=Paracoccus caeni TaxID=657651 RepID=A0A934VZC7_9RHOB|nr:GAD-like domain-containing protein [Paracoccus caeni]MBK4216917.1 hypothetical protein [Paracoccus caeni]
MKSLSSVGGQPGEIVLAELMTSHGPLTDARAVSEERITPRIGHVPDLLIDLWRLYGVGALRDGGLWLAMPGDFDRVTELVFGGDADLGTGTQLIAYGAMGNFLCWNSRYGAVLVSPASGAVQAPALTQRAPALDHDALLLSYLQELHPFFFDRVDRDNQPMLDRARAAWGPLSYGQIYAAYPIQDVGEGIGVENVAIDDAVDYLTEVARVTGFMLQDFENNRFNIRDIGSPK